jgi:hypothetical protein
MRLKVHTDFPAKKLCSRSHTCRTTISVDAEEVCVLLRRVPAPENCQGQDEVGRRSMTAPPPKMWSDMKAEDETDEPLVADHRNYYKVEKWTKDGARVEHMLYAGSDLDKARDIFQQAIKHRPRIRLTIRQRARVLEKWPQ